MSCDCCLSGLSSLIMGASRAFLSPIRRVSWCTSPDISSKVAPFLQTIVYLVILKIDYLVYFKILSSRRAQPSAPQRAPSSRWCLGTLDNIFQICTILRYVRYVSEPGNSPILLQSCQALLQTCLPAPQYLREDPGNKIFVFNRYFRSSSVNINHNRGT